MTQADEPLRTEAGPSGKSAGNDTASGETLLPLAEEQLSVHKRRVPSGRVTVRTVVDEEEHRVRAPISRENVHVTRIEVGREVESIPPIREEDDTLIVPLVEEVVVVSRCLVLKEELHIRKERHVETVEIPMTLRRTRAVVERTEADVESGSHDQGPLRKQD